MKISAAAAAPQASINPNAGKSAGPDRVARAKAILSGTPLPDRGPHDPEEQDLGKSRPVLNRIKMRTQRSPDRHLQAAPQEQPAAEPQTTAPTETQETGILEQGEPTAAATEATQPLSPQFAALAKQKRALQLKEQELLAKEKALGASPTQDLSGYVSKADIKANALKVLLAEGVTYDQLTEQILANNSDSPDLTGIKAELQALKEGLENQTKTQVQRDADTEKQVLSQMRKEADQLVAQGDDFEMVREAGYAPKVVELIHKTFKATGEILDVKEAATLIENELLEESLKFARIKKVQSRLAPAQVQEQQPIKQDGPNRKIMRTLTNRDGASSISMSKRERAIAAMEGRLK